MENVIELNNQTFTKELLDKATFYQFAHGGAMGEPGGIVFVTEDNSVYHANFCYGDVDEETVERAFPTLRELRIDIFGNGTAGEGWRHFYLGFGNYLLIREDRYNRFEHFINECRDHPSELYGTWLKKALSVNQQ